MSVFLAVANRKGGVGKSTVTTMLAHGLAAWSGRRVLVLDLDPQANASLILLGDHAWVEARRKNRTIADFITDFDPAAPRWPDEYIVPDAGDVEDDDGAPAPISVVAGSFEADERERRLLHAAAPGAASLVEAEQKVTQRIFKLLRRFHGAFDIILMDCPPGVSFISEAALQLADKVIAPFRPDYVSIFAVNRIALTIERATHAQLLAIPFERRRYVTLANLCHETSQHARIIQEIAVDHPMMKVRMPQLPAIADAFDWRGTPRSLAKKYGAALPYVRALHDETSQIIQSIRTRKKEG